MHPQEINMYECLAEAFNEYGYACQTDGTYFEFTPLNLFVDATIENFSQSTDGLISSIVRIKSTQLTAFPLGIVEYGYGWGYTEKDSVVNALVRWIESDFPPIHDYLCKEGKDTKMELLSFSHESGAILAWNVFLGPAIEIGAEGAKENQERRMDVFKIIFNSVTGDLLTQKGMYPIRCFLSKQAGDSIDVDCRVNGENWENGKYDLYEHLQSWPATESILALKQYMLIVPIELQDIQSKTLLAQLNQEVTKQVSPAKRWWQFWK